MVHKQTDCLRKCFSYTKYSWWPSYPKLQKQSIGKAFKKVNKVLPKSPSKKKVVVRALAESMGLISKGKNKSSTALSDVLIDTVKKFYL